MWTGVWVRVWQDWCGAQYWHLFLPLWTLWITDEAACEQHACLEYSFIQKGKRSSLVQSIAIDTRNTQQTPNFPVPSGDQLDAQRQEWARAALDGDEPSEQSALQGHGSLAFSGVTMGPTELQLLLKIRIQICCQISEMNPSEILLLGSAATLARLPNAYRLVA